VGGRGRDVGYLPQEPMLDPTKDREGQHRGGGGADEGVLARFEEVSMKLGEVMTTPR
jgi:sulfate-transporting ATPase